MRLLFGVWAQRELFTHPSTYDLVIQKYLVSVGVPSTRNPSLEVTTSDVLVLEAAISYKPGPWAHPLRSRALVVRQVTFSVRQFAGSDCLEIRPLGTPTPILSFGSTASNVFSTGSCWQRFTGNSLPLHGGWVFFLALRVFFLALGVFSCPTSGL